MLILIAEDDQTQQELCRACIEEIDNSIELLFAQNGYGLMSELAHCVCEGRLPNLVIIDLNMPYIGGREVLSSIKKDQVYSKIPMAILTSSSYPIDRYLGKMFKIPFYRKGDNKEECLAVIKSIFNNFQIGPNTTI